jgi:hypothetical protein
MAVPGDEIAAGAGGHGCLRASHADREQVIGTLKAAFVQGMLDRDEFGQRLGQAFAARTYADLAPLTVDLPAGLAAASPPTPARVQSEGRVRRPGLVLAVGTLLYASAWPVVLALPASGPGHESAGTGPLVILTFYYMIFLFIAGAMLVDTWQWKRSRKQLPPGQDPTR